MSIPTPFENVPVLGNAPQLLPSVMETQQALVDIATQRNAAAADLLRRLAEGVIELVSKLDHQENVSNYLVSLQIVCKGPGNFVLHLQDKNSEVDPEQLSQAIAEALQNRDNAYGKSARAIQLGFGDGPKD